MANMTYREMAIATVKMACQDVIDRVEDIIPKDTSAAFDIKLSISIPTMSDNPTDIPHFEVSMSSYPARHTFEEFYAWLMKGGGSNEKESQPDGGM